jgi:thiamine-phosphate pyrophosphorylase
LSVETPQDLIAAEAYELAYLGVSPVFDTPTKTDTLPAWGLEGLADARRLSRHPLVAIGGMNAGNAADAIAAGADGIAVVSAICSAADPRAAARTLRAAIDAAGRNRL